MSNPENQEAILGEFRRIWGYDQFRSPQGEIIQTLLTGQDALIVMPTGGGKSICFQLPALMQRGLTLVVSPLVALMENQVAELQQKRLPAALVHSQQSKGDRQRTLTALEHQRLRLLYLSPETLLSPALWDRLQNPALEIRGLILDEAHCLTQWGDSFRPAYGRLGAVRPALLQHRPGAHFPIAAFTATADPPTQATLCQVLGLRQPQRFLLNPYRPNLDLRVQCTWSVGHRRHCLQRYCQQHRGQSGLVYVRSRRDAETLAQGLRAQGHATAAYHGGLMAGQRRQIEGDWMADRLGFVVATNAFGMGVNKPTVRWVVHYQVPVLLAEYVQEVGRSGRDGQRAQALALVSEPTGWWDPSDRQRWQFFQQQHRTQWQTALGLVDRLPPEGAVAAVGDRFPQGELALGILHSLGRLAWVDPFHYRLLPGAETGRTQRGARKGSIGKSLGKGSLGKGSLGTVNTGAIASAQSQPMIRYLHDRGCRWGTILTAFGFAPATPHYRCGHCDQCRTPWRF